MWKRKKKKVTPEPEQLETRSMTLDEVRKAVHAYADDMPDGVPLSVIINHDLTLDYDLLSPYLKGKPEETFYMSRETYELFEADNRELAVELDMIQRAVDQYMEQTGELPIIESDPYRRVNFFKLERLTLIPYRPEREYYVTQEEFLVTYKKN
ncbi:DUF3939 domain-containing protein [Thalassobacillus sp. CUG 92003]|uniref:DUF3939 domain-containing protein n=1 Tax=Thalassobacillus sp. CUG 92003 TaxID=2736641 RepID=UPI0015E703CF|nr:DUF3939 domain-containing protein [Thalassobacillus sp. CUG 92003]